MAKLTELGGIGSAICKAIGQLASVKKNKEIAWSKY
jgi:hypothetical protein